MKTTQLENKINRLEKNKIDIDFFFCYKRKHKELIRNNESILKTQQSLKRERKNGFTEEINKIALSLNHDKRMQSSDSIETCAYGTSKHLQSVTKIMGKKCYLSNFVFLPPLPP